MTTDPVNPVPPEPNPVPPAAEPAAVETSKDAKTFGMLCHLLALAGFVIPLGNIVGPLVIWMMKKEAFPFVNDQGKESLNFQITVTIAMIIASVTTLICIGFVLMPLVGIAALVLVIIASMKANNGIAYRYPWTLRLIK